MENEKDQNEGNMDRGLQDAPEPGRTHYTPAEKTGEEILSGARNEDQLEQFKANTGGDDLPAKEQ